ncbi:hypothetical protein OH76DRAFT_438901 [Lentinus brumalis]|uniref:Uncharacterized protein n=1 Tax=Lentinus brumalis TaxID=2498619 RepID=A0A371DDY4_9APHY|nr:hypothetical protein OH76DRAFT_438901 [Polyporus brumalis]
MCSSSATVESWSWYDNLSTPSVHEQSKWSLALSRTGRMSQRARPETRRCTMEAGRTHGHTVGGRRTFSPPAADGWSPLPPPIHSGRENPRIDLRTAPLRKLELGRHVGQPCASDAPLNMHSQPSEHRFLVLSTLTAWKRDANPCRGGRRAQRTAEAGLARAICPVSTGWGLEIPRINLTVLSSDSCTDSRDVLTSVNGMTRGSVQTHLRRSFPLRHVHDGGRRRSAAYYGEASVTWSDHLITTTPPLRSMQFPTSQARCYNLHELNPRRPSSVAHQSSGLA